jgi:ribonuclease HI
MSSSSFYAVAKGKNTGIFNTWEECKMNTQGYPGAVFKKFGSKEQAEEFISDKRGSVTIHLSKVVEASRSEEKSQNAFDILMKPKIEQVVDYYVYTDGACSNNGKENALAGIGIYFGENDTRNVSQLVSGKQTNNTAELGAIIYLYNIIEKDIISGKNICIVSDSKYAIWCVTSYGKRCSEEGWKKDIPNKDIVKKAFELYKDKDNVQFLHVMAHTGKLDTHSVGNDGADKLANKAVGLTN